MSIHSYGQPASDGSTLGYSLKMTFCIQKNLLWQPSDMKGHFPHVPKVVAHSIFLRSVYKKLDILNFTYVKFVMFYHRITTGILV